MRNDLTRGTEPTPDGLRAAVAQAVRGSHGYFVATQALEGYWCGEVESNAAIEAEYLLFTHFVDIGDSDTWRKLANHILNVQREDGTWGQCYGAPGDLSAIVERYFALKLAGYSVNDSRLVKAWEFILQRGGVPQTRVFTKIWLALFGQWSWEDVAAVSPEISLLPSWFPMNLYDFSSWARVAILPLSIGLSYRPVCPIPKAAAILALTPSTQRNPTGTVPRCRMSGMAVAFHLADRACVSSAWATCLAMVALEDSGMPLDNPVLRRAAQWLIDAQITEGGDWQVKVKDTVPGGWAVEFANANYPDIDDTAEVLIALNRVRTEDSRKKNEAVRRGVDWMLAMQCSNGGWAAFDKDNTRRAVAEIPFVYFGEMLDPPCADVTAHVVEALAHLGYARDVEPIKRALRYLMEEQEPDGSWFGRPNLA